MNSVIYVLVIILVQLCGGCSTSSIQNARINSSMVAINHIVTYDIDPVVQFVKPKMGDILQIRGKWIEQRFYLVFFSKDEKTAVIYDFGEQTTPHLDLKNPNYGFGKLENNMWVLRHEDEGGKLFESNGGVWTFQRMRTVIQLCIKEKPLKNLIWGQGNRF